MGKIIKNDKQKLLNKELGELILIYRRRKKLSQEKLGELVNLTRQTIGLIEAGIPDLILYNMIMLIKVLEIPKEEVEKIAEDKLFKGENV